MAVDNERVVGSWRNVVQVRKKIEIYFGVVWAKTTESELMVYSNSLWCKPNQQQSKSKTIYIRWMLTFLVSIIAHY